MYKYKNSLVRFFSLTLLFAVLLNMHKIHAENNRLSSILDTGKHLDVILIIDESGSMRYTDKNRIAVQGSALFTELLEKNGSEVAVIGFNEAISIKNSDDIRSSTTDWLGINSLNAHKTVRDLIHRDISNDGDWTHIGDALEKAVALARSKHAAYVNNDDRKLAVILFTDGKIDFGDKKTPDVIAAEDADKIKAYQAAEDLKGLGCSLYVVGLNGDGKKFDEEFLMELIKKNGLSKLDPLVLNVADKRLVQYYQQIFAELIGSKPYQIDDNKKIDGHDEIYFSVEENVKEVNITIFPHGKKEVLVDYINYESETIWDSSQPNIADTLYISTQKPIIQASNVKEAYVIVKMVEPQPGDYYIGLAADNADVDIYAVYNEDLTITLNDVKDVKKDFETKFESQITGDLIGRKLNKTELENRFENGIYLVVEEKIDEDNVKSAISKMDLADDGTLTSSWTFEKEGDYSVYVAADGDKLKRTSNRISVTVSPEPTQPPETPSPPPSQTPETASPPPSKPPVTPTPLPTPDITSNIDLGYFWHFPQIMNSKQIDLTEYNSNLNNVKDYNVETNGKSVNAEKEVGFHILLKPASFISFGKAEITITGIPGNKIIFTITPVSLLLLLIPIIILLLAFIFIWFFTMRVGQWNVLLRGQSEGRNWEIPNTKIDLSAGYSKVYRKISLNTCLEKAIEKCESAQDRLHAEDACEGYCSRMRINGAPFLARHKRIKVRLIGLNKSGAKVTVDGADFSGDVIKFEDGMSVTLSWDDDLMVKLTWRKL